MRKKRLDLGLFQKEVAKKIGVTEETLYNWENNLSAPKLNYMPKIIEFLGYIPFKTEAKTLREEIVNYRRLCGLTQKDLANRLGVDPSILARWERNEGNPLPQLRIRVEAFLATKTLG